MHTIYSLVAVDKQIKLSFIICTMIIQCACYLVAISGVSTFMENFCHSFSLLSLLMIGSLYFGEDFKTSCLFINSYDRIFFIDSVVFISVRKVITTGPSQIHHNTDPLFVKLFTVG